jgi:hypothetical protein
VGGNIRKGCDKTGYDRNKWVHYDTIQGRSNPIVGSKLTSIHIDNTKRVIFSSEGRGIFIYDYKTDNFKNISEDDGLPNNVIYGVLDDPFRQPLGKLQQGAGNLQHVRPKKP